MKRVLITGACGFIGSCLASRLLAAGERVIGADDLSRRGSEINAAELAELGLDLHRLDLSDAEATDRLLAEIAPLDAVFHLAAQVAVTTSYLDRRRDFLGNAVASFNVIESVKRHAPKAYCLYASTNKVFGHVTVKRPIGLDRPLDPYTPYGVSKAVGELYFTEYGRPEIGLTTCCLRQSCIYGHHQFGVEDQGWMAWFAIANLLGLPVTIYGDGSQTRDLLFVEDLIDLYLECWAKRLTGVWPVGGGPANAIDLKQGLALIEKATGRKFDDIRSGAMRPGDQPYFVADLGWRACAGVDWAPRRGVSEGTRAMVEWIRANEAAIRKALEAR